MLKALNNLASQAASLALNTAAAAADTTAQTLRSTAAEIAKPAGVTGALSGLAERTASRLGVAASKHPAPRSRLEQRLPNEILGQVMNELDGKSQRNMRLVNHHFADIGAAATHHLVAKSPADLQALNNAAVMPRFVTGGIQQLSLQAGHYTQADLEKLSPTLQNSLQEIKLGADTTLDATAWQHLESWPALQSAHATTGTPAQLTAMLEAMDAPAPQTAEAQLADIENGTPQPAAPRVQLKSLQIGETNAAGGVGDAGGLTDADILRLPASLEKLVLTRPEPGITAAGWQALKEHPNLKEISVITTSVPELNNALIAGDKLTTLDMHKVLHAPAAALQALPASLQQLKICGDHDMFAETGAARAAVAHIRQLPNLKSLDVAVFTPHTLTQTVQDFGGSDSKLTGLTLQSHTFKDIHIETLPQSLTHLQIRDNFSGITSGGLAQLGRLPQLEHLALQGPDINDAAAQALATHPTLRSLSTFYAGITAKGAQALAQSKSLQSVSIPFNRLVGDAGARALLANSNITTLNIAGARLSPQLNAELGNQPPVHLHALTFQ